MAGSVNKVILRSYLNGASIPEISALVGKPRSTVLYHVVRAGIVRTREEGVRNAAKRGRLSKRKGVKRGPFPESWRKAIALGRAKWADIHAVGYTKKTNGYIEFTRGDNKHRSIHVVLMEQRLGRKLLSDECVHHIDGDKHNNEMNNLSLMTLSGHSRHHRMIERLMK